MAVAGNVVWLPRYSDDTVLSVDTATDQTQVVNVGDGPAAVAVGEGSVWVANSGDGTVSEVAAPATRSVSRSMWETARRGSQSARELCGWRSASTARSRRSIRTQAGSLPRFRSGTNPTRVAVGFGKVWVTNESVGTVTPIDPATDTTGTPIAVGQGPERLAIGADAVWVTNSLDGSVSRIDPGTLVWPRSRRWRRHAGRDGGRRHRLGGGTPLCKDRPPRCQDWTDQIEPGGGRQSAGCSNPRRRRRGHHHDIPDGAPRRDIDHRRRKRAGLRDRPSVDPDSFDAWFPVVWDSLAVTNDGLVSLKRVPGPDGGTVVADLAKALPTVTDGGLTYAFQLREGIRYSTGRPVRCERHPLRP